MKGNYSYLMNSIPKDFSGILMWSFFLVLDCKCLVVHPLITVFSVAHFLLLEVLQPDNMLPPLTCKVSSCFCSCVIFSCLKIHKYFLLLFL